MYIHIDTLKIIIICNIFCIKIVLNAKKEIDFCYIDELKTIFVIVLYVIFINL